MHGIREIVELNKRTEEARKKVEFPSPVQCPPAPSKDLQK